MWPWAFLLLPLLAACTDLPDHSPPAPARVQEVPGVFVPPLGFERLRLGLTPFSTPETLKKTHKVLAEYLSRQLSMPIDVEVGASYGDTVDRLIKGEFDMVELSPYAYVEASAHVKLRCLVQSIADGSASASGYIFVRDDSPRRTLEDLKGSRFAFVEERSTSGYLYPMKVLRDHGLEPKRDFASVEFLGNHEAVLLAVLEGRIDAGATYQGSFALLKRTRGVDPLSFRVIGKTPRTPRDIYCVRPEVPVEVAETITRAMLSLNGRDRAGREILGPLNINGYTQADDHAYDGVRQLAASVAAH